jgi:hypothetical protein
MKVKYVINKQVMTQEQYESHGQNRLSEILATHQFPGLKTDDDYLKGRRTLADQLGDDGARVIVEAAQRNGYTPGINDYYHSGLAAFQGDPQAFIKHHDARGHVTRICEQRGWSCHGSVNVKGRRDEAPRVPLAADIAYAAGRRIASEQGLRISVKDAMREAEHQHGPNRAWPSKRSNVAPELQHIVRTKPKPIVTTSSEDKL